MADPHITLVLSAKRTPPNPGRRHVYLYDVLLDGQPLVLDSSDPEFDAARALLAKGITGTAILLDSGGRPRTIIYIEKASQLRTVEEQRRTYFAKWHPP